MSRPCDSLDLFFDGELPPDERAAFEAHLVGCADCQRELHALMQLTAATMTPPAAPVIVLRPRIAAWKIAAPMLAIAAGVALWVSVPGPEDMSGETGDIVALQLGPTRGLEARLGAGPVDMHRAYTVMRAQGASGEPISLAELARLEAAGDLRGLAAAHALRGEPTQAQAVLERLPASPDRESDRAALALALAQPATALVLADEALAGDPSHPQARWNRALALRDLELPRSAAAEFDRIEGEGWAAEARGLAAALREPVDARERVFAAVQAAGEALLRDGTAMPDALVSAAPGLARLYFYDALRAAPTRARAESLRGLASSLDARAGGRVLQDLLARIETADFGKRAAIAGEYARLALGETVDGAALAVKAHRAGQDDIAIGALVQVGALDGLEALARTSGDPWMRMLAAQTIAGTLVGRGDYDEAERTLLAAHALCGPGLDYRCARIELALAELYALVHRLVEATPLIDAGLQRVRTDQHWGSETTFLQLRAEVARLRGDFGVARAITGETLLRLPVDRAARCLAARHASDVLAGLASFHADVPEIRRSLAIAPDCGRPPSLTRLFAQADLAGITRDPADIVAVKDGLQALRAAPLTPGEQALADHIEGRVLALDSLPAGENFLNKSIAAALELPRSDPHALKALSFSHAMLAAEAAVRQDAAGALRVLAQEVGAAGPTSCAVGLVRDRDRMFVVGLDAAGLPYTGALASVTAALPAELSPRLRACPEVAVFARPPFAGRPGLLPPDIAWSYRVGHPDLRTGPSGQVEASARLVVADAVPPASLHLPPLLPWQRDTGTPGPVVLAGPDATPSRVLAAMAGARVIEFHVHGLVDLGVSDASFLALSADADGRHALTAGQIRELRLANSPLVILGACHAGQVAPYLHEAWSLPLAFLEAGARAVIASPAPVQDREAGPFFAGVRQRIADGASPAVAVRDERVRLGADAGWAASVLVFAR